MKQKKTQKRAGELTWIGEAANTPEKAEKLVELFHGVKTAASAVDIDMDSIRPTTPQPARR